MRSALFGKRLALCLPLLAVVWAGCGGKKNSTTTNSVTVTISPTNVSVAAGTTQQFTATVTGSTNTAVTWQVGGVTGGNANIGTINSSGLYTAPTAIPSSTDDPGTPNVNIGAISQANTNAVANSSVTITAPAITISITCPSGTNPCTSINALAGSQQQFTAKVSGGATNAVTWSVCNGNTACGTIDQTGLYTAPLSPPQEPITVVATSKDNSIFAASTSVTVQFAPASLQGQYVFLVSQPDGSSGSGFAARAGVFTANGTGNISGGIEDSNSTSSGVATAVPFNGTYTITPDGRGQMIIDDGATHTFSFALTSNTRGQVIGFDSGVASGILRQQDQTAIAGVSGPFVFGLTGDNSGPAAALGQLIFTGSTITGTEDISVNGAITQTSGIAGSFTPPSSGRGTAVISSSNFAYYIIDASDLILISSTGAHLAGNAYAQSTSAFTTASLGSSAYFVAGNAIPGNKPYAQVGRFDTDGVSKFSGGVFDTNNAGTLTSNAPFGSGAGYSFTGAQANGRGMINTGSSNFIFWLASSKFGVIMEADPTSSSVASGLLFQQQTSIPSLIGGFSFAVDGASFDGTSAQAVDGQLTILGTLQNFSGTEDLNNAGVVASAVTATGALQPASNGRSIATFQASPTNGMAGNLDYDLYFVSPNRLIMLSATPNTSVLAGTAERQCSDCQF